MILVTTEDGSVAWVPHVLAEEPAEMQRPMLSIRNDGTGFVQFAIEPVEVNDVRK